MLPTLCAVVTAAGISLAKSETAAEEQAKMLGQAEQRMAAVNTHPDAQWFPKAGFGVFIHWGIAAVGEVGDLSWSMLANRPWFDGTHTPNEYYGLIKQWNPDKMDMDRMLGQIKAAGAQYAVFVTKHHDGFTFWPSAHGDIGTKHSFGGRDFVKEFVDGCRKHGLKVGLYYSPPDWWFDRNYKSFSFRGKQTDMDHKEVASIPKAPPEHNAARAALIHGQVTELLKNYGRIDLLWFDGGNGKDISMAEVRKLMPGIVVNRRNGGQGDFGDSEGGLPSKQFSGWFEACVPAWPVRKWSYVKDYGNASAADVLAELVMIRAWGGNLLSNVGPKADGSIVPEVVAIWKEMAGWMKHSKESVYDVLPGRFPDQCDVPLTLRKGAGYLHFLPEFPERIPGMPRGERKFTRYKDVMPMLSARKTKGIWKGAPEVAKVTMLRTGKKIPFTYENGTLTVDVPEAERTKLVDVVKVTFKK